MSRAGRAAITAALLAAAVVASSQDASAYCRTATCGDVIGARCDPPQPTDCGIALFWPSQCVGYSVQRDGTSDVDFDTVEALTDQAFDAWENASCGDGHTPSIRADNLGPVSCDLVEYDAELKNANIVVFRDDEWTHSSGSTLALTTVTFALETGKIRDADIELNSADVEFSTSDDDVDVDLLSILTHEAGHFLGLAHVPDADSTMFSDYPPKSTSLRSLSEDDQAGICAVYPPGSSASCSPDPVNGLGDECATPADIDEDEGGCTVTGAPTRSGAASFFASALALGVVALRRRHR